MPKKYNVKIQVQEFVNWRFNLSPNLPLSPFSQLKTASLLFIAARIDPRLRFGGDPDFADGIGRDKVIKEEKILSLRGFLMGFHEALIEPGC